MNPEAQLPNNKFQWQWNWKILLFAVLFFPLTLRLGFWQLSRADEKQALLDIHQQRVAAPLVDLAEVPDMGDRQYLRVTVNGQYDNRATLLLDNRVRRGRPGYEVISVFRPAVEGAAILVNRGWIAGSLDRSVLPEVELVESSVTLSGYLYRSPGKQVMLGADPWQADKPLQIIQNAAPEVVSGRFGETFYDYSLRLDAKAPGALQTGWHVVNVRPEKHMGYAVQWFAMAILLVLLTVLANSNLGALRDSRKARKKSNNGESND